MAHSLTGSVVCALVCCVCVDRAGADEFLPVFIYVVLRANVRQVLTNARYIERFRYPGGLMSKYVGACLHACVSCA